MISSREDARRLVDSCRYPPVGRRSFGPTRGLLYGGQDYLLHANDEIVVLAMIETAEGLERVEEIVDTRGIDGVYIGPNDLALALGSTPVIESDDAIVVDAIARIRKPIEARGLIAGIFCIRAQRRPSRVSGRDSTWSRPETTPARCASSLAKRSECFATPGSDALLSGSAAVLLSCVADDFTGSGNLANTLARGGRRTVFFICMHRRDFGERRGWRGGAQVAVGTGGRSSQSIPGRVGNIPFTRTLKSGNFGDADFFTMALAVLRAQCL
ncbi:MAG: aldolase/citrate lyase family protein [Rubrivivax sp.]